MANQIRNLLKGVKSNQNLKVSISNGGNALEISYKDVFQRDNRLSVYYDKSNDDYIVTKEHTAKTPSGVSTQKNDYSVETSNLNEIKQRINESVKQSKGYESTTRGIGGSSEAGTK